MLLSLDGVRLWFDVSGPSVLPDGETTVDRPTIVAVHGGPGVDHINMKAKLTPLAEHFQIVYYDQRGHGRSDHSTAEHWNLRTWADDLRQLCDALGLDKPIVLGTSFGGFVVLTYAALFPDHPGGIILGNTTGGRLDYPGSIEVYRRLGGDEAAAAAEREFVMRNAESDAEFARLCSPLHSARPGAAEYSRQESARSIATLDVNLHYFRDEAARFDPWSVLSNVTCPVLVLAGEDDPICPLAVVEELASKLPGQTTRLVRLPQASHAIFRDRPDLAFPAVVDFVREVGKARTTATAR
jgi:pimeloyl-ACP methyl ester carboxylesterase